MNDDYVVVDATIAVKWVVEEDGTAEALALLRGRARRVAPLRGRARRVAPEPLVAECADILWKKVRRGELTQEEASLAARLLQSSDMELVPTRALLEPALQWALQLDLSAHDCMYLALAVQRDCRLITADERLVRRMQKAYGVLHERVRGLKEFTPPPARTVSSPELSAEQRELVDKLQEGTVVCGTVRHLADYGALVDLGGINGLVHITDMAWKRVKHPSEVVKVGDEIHMRILDVDRERARISLGLKQLRADPWRNIERRYPVQTRVLGKVTRFADYGVFIELEEGVEGLVHVSDLDWTRRNLDPAEVLQLDQQVEVMVLDVDPEHRRLALGLKQCRARPGAEGIAAR
jgi:predicted RNA-binding protein with RPS1 domain/predicted nucleic acid-binding protein